jgi:hypothetical protein
MSDDDVMDYVYGKLFGDLDGIESHTLFDEDGEEAVEGEVSNAAPASQESGGVKITVEPIMAAAQESGKPSDTSTAGDEEEEKEKLKGIADISPLMAQLHGRG